MKTTKSDILSEQMRRLVDSGFGAAVSAVRYNDIVINIVYPSDYDSFLTVFADTDRYPAPVRKYLNCRTYDDVSEAVRYINAAEKVTHVIDDNPILAEGSMESLFEEAVIRLKDLGNHDRK